MWAELWSWVEDIVLAVFLVGVMVAAALVLGVLAIAVALEDLRRRGS